jgi:hypothetical protein
MKITYMLWNQSSVESEIPIGQAWKWILHLEHEIEIHVIFKNLKQKILDSKLTLLNLHIDQQCSTNEFLNLACESYEKSVICDEFMPVSRIISTHTENYSVLHCLDF